MSAKKATEMCCLHRGQDDNQSQVSTVTFLGRSNNSRGSSVCTVLQNLPANVVQKWEEELCYSKTNMRSCVYDYYFPDFKFCNQTICECVVKHSLRSCGLKVTEGMNKQQFVICLRIILVVMFEQEQRHIRRQQRRAISGAEACV